MKHTAITIGPIIKSLGLAQKTRELWAASYFFSFLMEKIIENLGSHKDKIIFPYPDKNKLISDLKIDTGKIKSAGIFPDRLLLESENGLFDELQHAVDKAIKDMKETFNFSCNTDELKNYLTTHIIEFEYKPRDLKTDNNEDNIIYQTNDFLANCELQANYTAKDKECFLKMFDRFYKTKFYKDKFSGNGFPSILEIATTGLNIEKIDLSEDVEDDNEIWKEIKKQNNNELKTNKKYIAIVQADGDSIGEIIKQVANQGADKVKDFSKALSSFSLLAAQEIANYGGEPVYTGGDDLLFFAPVTNKEDNIFKLIERLDEIFKLQITDKFKTSKTPSMSYGLSISYYKFPMHEALNTARNLLFGEAKKEPKNAIASKVLQHSGQTFSAVLSKPLKEEFTNLLHKDEGLVINSILHNFTEHKTLLKQSLKQDSNASLDAFFENFYNEDIHKNSKDFIKEVKELLEATSEQLKKLKNETEDDFLYRVINQVKTQLKLIKFLNNKKDD